MEVSPHYCCLITISLSQSAIARLALVRAIVVGGAAIVIARREEGVAAGGRVSGK
jgi:hypothetical protein